MIETNEKQEILTPAPPTVATPRNTSRRQWLHQTALLGAAFAAMKTVAHADDMPAMTTAPGTDAPMNMATMGGAPMMGYVKVDSALVLPTGSQAVAENSVIPGKENPNNPAKVIPEIPKTAAPSDVDILNFALGLEYLEAEYYANAVAAHQRRAYLSPAALMAAQKLAADEAAHVAAILEILTAANATPSPKPSFQFPENAFYSTIAFLDLAATFEVTGVGAYLGAAPKVVSNSALRFAASVYGVEARHVGAIRALAGLDPSPTTAEIPLSMEQVLERVKPFIVA